MYDQMGEYFIAIFKEKPDFHRLKKYLMENHEEEDSVYNRLDEKVGNILRGIPAKNVGNSCVEYHLKKVKLLD